MGIFRRSRSNVPAYPLEPGQYRREGDPIGSVPIGPTIPGNVPVNTVAPTISGAGASTTVGTIFTAVRGTWTFNPVLSGVWRRDGVAIVGANQLTYIAVAADLAAVLDYYETAINSAGVTYADSNNITITAAASPVPSVTAVPTITYTGSLTTNTVLTGVPGTYVDSVSVAKSWTKEGVPIVGATASTYTVLLSDVGSELRYREVITNANGSVEALSLPVIPSQPTGGTVVGLQESFVMANQPPSVSIQRTGTGSTYGLSSGLLKIVTADNEARYHHDASGVFQGLYVEKSRTNQASHSILVGTQPPFTTSGAGCTATLNYAVSPTGATNASRLQVNAGTVDRGFFRGRSVPSGSLRNSVWLKSNTGSSQLVTLRNPASGYQQVLATTVWQRFDLVGVNEGGSWFNDVILNPLTSAMDILVFLLDVTAGGELTDSLIANGASDTTKTRPVETLVVQTSQTGTRDIQVTFDNGSTQVFSGQSLTNGVFSVSATALNRNLVKQVDVYSSGSIQGAPPPGPTPTPAPTPPPSGGLVPLQPALSIAMNNPPGREARAVHSVSPSWSANYPEPSRYPPSYSTYVFPNMFDEPGYSSGVDMLPWLVFWDEATTAYGFSHINNPANKKVALHVRDWYLFVHFSDTNQWEVFGPVQLTSGLEQYDGNFGQNSNQPAGDFPPDQSVVWSDGTKGAILKNESGITSPSQVRMQHSWSTKTRMPASRKQYIDAIGTAFLARLEPVTTAASGLNIGGTATDVANARLLLWNGIDHYPASGTKPDTHALMAGRPRFVTGEYQWYASWVRDGTLDQNWIDTHPVSLTGSGGSAPPPAAPPPSAPPPSGGSTWDSGMVERAIVTATGRNEGLIINVDNNAGGWRSGAGLAMGNRWNSAPPMPSSWSWPTGNGSVYDYWPYFYPWGVIFIEQGNSATDGWIEFRNLDWQILYRNASSWTRLSPKNNNIGWGELFQSDMITSTGTPITKRTGPGGGTSIKVPTNNSPHFTFTSSGVLVPNTANIEGVLITFEMRIEPNGSQDVKALVHIGGDPKKTTGGNSADGVPWYPGVQVSAAIKATTDWKRVTSANIQGIPADSSQVDRTMTQARIRAVPPLV